MLGVEISQSLEFGGDLVEAGGAGGGAGRGADVPGGGDPVAAGEHAVAPAAVAADPDRGAGVVQGDPREDIGNDVRLERAGRVRGECGAQRSAGDRTETR